MSKAQSADAIEPLDTVAARALTESMSVLTEVPPVRGADGMFDVTTQSGSTYIVDAREGACECPDTRYLDRTCKHQLRVAFETGRWEIPAWRPRRRRLATRRVGRHRSEVERVSLRCPECGTTDCRLVDDNGVTDPADGNRVEHFECGNYHTFTKVLRA